jgi:uncharacterized protein YjdB
LFNKKILPLHFKRREMKKNLLLTILAMAFSVASFALGPITGMLSACIGGTSRLVDSLNPGGTWSSSNPSIATVHTTSGSVYGVAAGTATITYTLGSAYTTATFTVSAAPAAIAGSPGTMCIGATATLTDATSGGTWSSSNPYSVTVNPSTGVITASHSGTATIYYTIGSGCSVSVTITVASSYLADSIYCAPTVCVGSSTTATIATSGGTWTSSNPSIATIGSSSGVITGVSAGTAILTYSVSGSCGAMSTYSSITVVASTSVAAITGTTTAVVGSSATLHDVTTGGSWSSSNPSIATVSTTGVVTGVAAGTATISYGVSGCSGMVYATTSFTVTSFGGISGNVIFSSSWMHDTVKVWLITYNSSSLMLQAVDSMMVTGAYTSSVYYSFPSPATGTYRIKAASFDSMRMSYGYVPTYHDTSFYWFNANTVNHTAGTADINKNINMAYGTATSGPGFIGGNVTTGANKGTATAPPAIGMQMYLVNTTTNTLIAATKTDMSGNYSFSSLPVGQTYKVFPEDLNYITYSYNGIALTASSPSMTAASFEQHTISKTITPIVTGVANVTNGGVEINAFPSPASDKLFVQWGEGANQSATVTLTDAAGHSVHTSGISMNGAGRTAIDVNGLAAGMYLVQVKGAGISYTCKVVVSH